MPINPADPITEVTGRRIQATILAALGVNPPVGVDYGDYGTTLPGGLVVFKGVDELFAAHCLGLDVTPAAWSNGDEVQIAATGSNGSTASGTYTFATGDTVQELMDAIQLVLDNLTGNVLTVTLVTGRLTVTDGTAGVSQSGLVLTFNDVSPSDTSWTEGLGTMGVETLGANAIARLLTASAAFSPAAGATVMNVLVGIGGDPLDGDELIRISGLDDGGVGVTPDDVLLTATLNDLVAAIDILFPTGTATLVAGVLRWTQDTPGAGNLTTITLTFVDPADAAVAQAMEAAAPITLELGGNVIAASLLAAIAQSGDLLDTGPGEVIRISGNDIAGVPITPVDVRVDLGNDVQDLMDAIQTFHGQAPGACTLAAGVLKLTIATAGASLRTLALAFVDTEAIGTTTYNDFPVAFANNPAGADAEGTSTFTPPTMAVTAAGTNAIAQVKDTVDDLTVAGVAATAGASLLTIQQITGILDAGGFT